MRKWRKKEDACWFLAKENFEKSQRVKKESSLERGKTTSKKVNKKRNNPSTTSKSNKTTSKLKQIRFAQ